MAIITNVDKLRINEIDENNSNNKLLSIDKEGLIVSKDLIYIFFDSIEDLEQYSGEASGAVVAEKGRGGVFVKKQDGVPDNGIVFEDSDGSFWHRQYNVSEGINVLWYGADNSGLGDNSAIIESLMLKETNSYSKIVFPSGIYRVTKQIGDIPSGSVSGNQVLEGKLEIKGIGDCKILVDSEVEIGAVFGFEVLEVKLIFDNLEIDGNNKANRGLYFRQEGVNAVGKDTSEATIKNCTINNILGDTGTVQSTIQGIILQGNWDANIFNNKIYDIKSTIDQKAVGGIRVSGSNDSPIGLVNIVGNEIKRVANTFPGFQDSDGIMVQYRTVETNNFNTNNTIIRGNYLEDCSKRFVKLQSKNASVSENIFSTTTDFIFNDSSFAVDFQYGNGILENNKFLFEGDSPNVLVKFNNRDLIKSTQFVLVKGNYVKSMVDLNIAFQQIISSDSALAGSFINNFIIEDNRLDCDINRLIEITCAVEDVYIPLNVNKNTINKIKSIFLDNTYDSNILLNASYNVIKEGDVSVSNFKYQYYLIGNIGLDYNDSLPNEININLDIGSRNYFSNSILTEETFSASNGNPLETPTIFGTRTLTPFAFSKLTTKQYSEIFEYVIIFWDENEDFITSTYPIDGNTYIRGGVKTYDVPSGTKFITYNFRRKPSEGTLIVSDINDIKIQIEKGQFNSGYSPSIEDLKPSGASGSYTTLDSKVVTVVDGLIVSIE